MSQSAQFTQGSDDPFLPSMNDDGDATSKFSPADFDALFANFKHEQTPVFSYSGSDADAALYDLDLGLESAPAFDDSTNPSSGASTPDLEDYVFGQRSGNGTGNGLREMKAYPLTPRGDEPHPYPVQQQHTQQRQLDVYPHNPLRGRPLATRSTTASPAPNNNLHLHPHQQRQPQSSRVNQPFHRRSLSQGSMPLQHNQAFFRVVESRKKSPAYSPQSPTDPGAGTKEGGVNVGGYQNRTMAAPTSMPVQFRRTMGTPTSIGTPIQITGSGMERGQDGSGQWQSQPQEQYQQQQQYFFRHMSPADQMHESARVIEVGAMVVLNDRARRMANTKTLDPNLAVAMDRKSRILEMVDQVEQHLRLQMGDVGTWNQGLEGCRLIRAALGVENVEGDGDGDGEIHLVQRSSFYNSQTHAPNHVPASPKSYIAPSEIFTGDEDLYMGAGDDDMFKMILEGPCAGDDALE
ncbi:hypothetical protein BCR34DRAFT_588928 [Clohesyomyces aquaticus]|uniref:Uncharacterized protein n=1 Tax=Clohesyomyces aquaticus TaxID=1231657 RepID=A0A1Y1ZJH9_9PLEO|nr:hypothetical protein BCR34DRAFT_588928 [Clohesyomyces aquaticus]